MEGEKSTAVKILMLRRFTYFNVAIIISTDVIFIYVIVKFVIALIAEFNLLVLLLTLFLSFFTAIIFYIFVYQLRREICGYVLIDESGISAIYLGRSWFNAKWADLVHFGIFCTSNQNYTFFSKIDSSAKDWVSKHGLISNGDVLVTAYTKKLSSALQKYCSNSITHYGTM